MYALRPRVLACAFLVLVVASLLLAAPALAQGKPSPTVELGNNVSVPVIFSEGYNIVGGDVSSVGSGFRSAPLVDNFDSLTTYTPRYWLGVTDPVTGACLDLAGSPLLSNWFYDQKTEATWQAEWVDATSDATSMSDVDVTRLDWGDSLLSKAWTVRSKLRIEVRLYRDNDRRLIGYGMNHVYGSGITEVWGAADASPVGAGDGPYHGPHYVTPAETTIYSNCARLSLYRIDALGGAVVSDELLDGDGMAVADKYGSDGPSGFGAEVNVGGFVLYGYTLDAKAMRLPVGFYRVVFSLDPAATWDGVTVNCNAVITGLDEADSVRDGTTESEWPFKSELASDGFSSWVDIQILAK
jgi:hypothetical protein